MGIHNVHIMVRDADKDRDSDSLLSEVFEKFETSFDELKQYVICEIDQLIQEIQESPDYNWQKK
ncbi:MAG: hypothetical protein ACFE8N_11905 [Promethearchaeota archaeon]